MTSSTLPSPVCALPPKQAAHYLHSKFGLAIRSDRTLRKLAERGEGPPRHKHGRNVLYRVDDLDRYGFSVFRIDPWAPRSEAA